MTETARGGAHYDLIFLKTWKKYPGCQRKKRPPIKCFTFTFKRKRQTDRKKAKVLKLHSRQQSELQRKDTGQQPRVCYYNDNKVTIGLLKSRTGFPKPLEALAQHFWTTAFLPQGSGPEKKSWEGCNPHPRPGHSCWFQQTQDPRLPPGGQALSSWIRARSRSPPCLRQGWCQKLTIFSSFSKATEETRVAPGAFPRQFSAKAGCCHSGSQVWLQSRKS